MGGKRGEGRLGDRGRRRDTEGHFPQGTPRAANLSYTLISASRLLPPSFIKCKGRHGMEMVGVRTELPTESIAGIRENIRGRKIRKVIGKILAGTEGGSLIPVEVTVIMVLLNRNDQINYGCI